MAVNVHPTIKMLLTQCSESLKLADSSPGQASGSPSKASVAQLETSKLERSESKRPNFVNSLGDDFSVNYVGEDNVGKSAQSKSKEKEAEPSLSKMIKLAEENKTIPDTGLSKKMKLAEECKMFPDATLLRMIELAKKYQIFPDAAMLETFFKLLPKLPAPSEKSSAKRSISPPLNQALTQRASILSHQKPGASHLRNEILESPTNDDQQASDHDVGQSEQYLKEKARLETFRQRGADMLMKRQKKKAEAHRACEEQLKREADMRMKKWKRNTEANRARVEQFKESEQKYETLYSKMRAGVLSADEFLADLAGVVVKMNASKEELVEENRLKLVGGRMMDMLVERQRKMAQADGVADELLPPWTLADDYDYDHVEPCTAESG